jgi:hypothetical protein
MKIKTLNFPYLSIALSAVLFLIVAKGSQPQGDSYSLPLLTLLVVSEFAFIFNAIAVYIGIKNRTEVENTVFYTITIVVCFVFATWFLLMGVNLWPTMHAAG